MIQAEGLLGEFECLYPGAQRHAWFVNGIASTSLTSEIRVAGASEGRPSVLTIPAWSQFNNSVLQCKAVFLISGVTVVVFFSRTATLIVGEWDCRLYIPLVIVLLFCFLRTCIFGGAQ